MGLGTKGWGDESHPDTAIASHFCAYVLGIEPTAPGYARFKVRPQPTHNVRWAKGLVPTPRGAIRCEWERAADGAFALTLTVPKGTRADVELPEGGTVIVNGKARPLSDFTPGVYCIVAEGLPSDAWADPADGHAATAETLTLSAKASSSHEVGGWGTASLFAPAHDTTKAGYSSGEHPSADATEWIEIDLGEEATLARLVLVPRADDPDAGFLRAFTVELAKEPGKYTTVKSFTDCPSPGKQGLVIDLHTVIGFPSVRIVRITASKLGAPTRDEPGRYRLQFSRIHVLRPEELRAQ